MSFYENLEKSAAVDVSKTSAVLQDNKASIDSARKVKDHVSYQQGTVTFPAFITGIYAGDKKDSVTLHFVPVGMEGVLASSSPVVIVNGVSSPVYSVATQDKSCMSLNTVIMMKDPTPENPKKTRVNLLASSFGLSPVLIANMHPLSATLWKSGAPGSTPVPTTGAPAAPVDANKAAAAGPTKAIFIPSVYTLVTLKGFSVKVVTKDGATRGFNSVDSVSTEGWEFFNALPELQRVALFANAEALQMPEVEPLTRLAPQFNATAGSKIKERGKKERKDKEYLAKDILPALPLVIVQSYCGWKFDSPVGDDVTLPMVLAPLGFPAQRTPGAPLTSSRLYCFNKPKTSSGVTFANVKFGVNVDGRDGTQKRYRAGLTLFSSHLANVGVSYKALLEPFLENNPVPFIAMASVQAAETMLNEINVNPSSNTYFPDGVVDMSIPSVIWRTPEYITRCLIPVSRDLIRERYGGDKISSELSNSDYGYANGSNPFEDNDALTKVGISAFDTPVSKRLPPATANVLYYAAPLFPVDLPMIERPDPACLLPVSMQPKAVNFTPEQGDAYVRRFLTVNRDPTAPAEKEHDAWMQWKREDQVVPIPHFLFFAVRPGIVPTTAPPAAPWIVPAPAVSSADAILPKDMNALRRAIIQRAVEKSQAPVLAPAVVDSLKRPLEADHPDKMVVEGDEKAAEPAAKKARTE